MAHLIVNERTRKGKQLMEQVKNGFFKANEVKVAASEPSEHMNAVKNKQAEPLEDLELADTMSMEEFGELLLTGLDKAYKKKALR